MRALLIAGNVAVVIMLSACIALSMNGLQFTTSLVVLIAYVATIGRKIHNAVS